MSSALKPIAAITVATLTADAVWLTLNHPYHAQLFKEIQHEPMTVRWFPAALVYVLIVAAIYFFAVRDAKSLLEAAGRGALIGLSMYGLYDLTNYATLTNYSFSMTVTDMLWGTTLCAFGALVGFYIRSF